MTESKSRRIHPLAMIGALVFALLILGLTYFFFNSSARKLNHPNEQPIYNITMIAAPTPTPTIFAPTQLPTPTPLAPNILPEGAIGIGSFVKVVGTSGLGLNIRSSAGRGQSVNFLAMDSEMFEVIGGPIVIDDLIWWQIEAPYDSSRNGWAAENYLERITQDNP